MHLGMRDLTMQQTGLMSTVLTALSCGIWLISCAKDTNDEPELSVAAQNLYNCELIGDGAFHLPDATREQRCTLDCYTSTVDCIALHRAFCGDTRAEFDSCIWDCIHTGCDENNRYTDEARCDGFIDCQNGADEANCDPSLLFECEEYV